MSLITPGQASASTQMFMSAALADKPSAGGAAQYTHDNTRRHAQRHNDIAVDSLPSSYQFACFVLSYLASRLLSNWSNQACYTNLGILIRLPISGSQQGGQYQDAHHSQNADPAVQAHALPGKLPPGCLSDTRLLCHGNLPLAQAAAAKQAFAVDNNAGN